MKIEFDITLNSRDMYRFSMHHAYTGNQGILSIIMAAVSFFAAAKTRGSVEPAYTVLYAVFGTVFLVYIPFTLYLRSKHQILTSEVLRNPLHYVIDDGGIHTSQNEANADLPWDAVYKIISTGHNVLVYSNRVNAYIIPKEQIKEKYEEIRRIAEANLPKHRFKMK